MECLILSLMNFYQFTPIDMKKVPKVKIYKPHLNLDLSEPHHSELLLWKVE